MIICPDHNAIAYQRPCPVCAAKPLSWCNFVEGAEHNGWVHIDRIPDAPTPGPWKVRSSVDSDFLGVYPDTGRAEFPIAKMPDFVRADLNEANARLIAAAPELLAALHWAITAADRLAEVTPPGVLRTGIRAKTEECRAAIAKATTPHGAPLRDHGEEEGGEPLAGRSDFHSRGEVG